MRKTLNFGEIAYDGRIRKYTVEIEIELDERKKEKPVFTASANVWNTSHTDIVMGGQCLDDIWNEYKHEIRNPSLYEKILGLWKRNHLNDLNAGCEHQRALNWTSANLCQPCPVCGYKWGTAWLYRPISESDLQEIKVSLGILE